MLILLWGVDTEAPLAAVHRELNRFRVPALFVDQTELFRTNVVLRIHDRSVEGWIRVQDKRADLRDITAAYLRPYDPHSLFESEPEESNDAALRRAILLDGILAAWSQVTSALIVNRFDAMAVNGSKPYQLQLIRKAGWSVPATLVTTDPDAAEEFWGLHGTVIYKSVSGTRSRVSRLSPEHKYRLLDVVACPTQFQQYIVGRDYRVHVIGEKVFTCELICDADDYRYPGQHRLEIRACTLPQEIEHKCRALAHSMRLPLAGIDVRRTPEGEWFCFEVNPSPAFTFYEDATGQPMARAVAELLCRQELDVTMQDQCRDSGTALLRSPGIVEPVAWDF